MPVTWMVGAGLAGWLATLAVWGDRVHPETLGGLAGPLVAAVVSWGFMVRARARGPEALTRVLMVALGGKMVWFGAYVVILLQGFDLRPTPFVASFVGFFVTLHVIEAVCLRRLTAGGRAPLG